MSLVRRKRPSQSLWSAMLAVALLIPAAGEPAVAKRKKKAEAKTPEDLLIVDCRLPGQVRQLGNAVPYQTPQRPVRTTAIDCRIRGGEYVAYDRASYSSALEVWQPKAAEGDPEAQTYVGEIYERGLAGAPDFESAALWYRRAAEQDDPRAQVNLAHLYEEGLGVPQDPEAARRWYGRAAGIPDEVILDSEQRAKQLRRELDALEARMESAQDELDEAKRQLERKQQELDEARRRLEENRSQSGEQDPQEVERLEAEVAASAEAEQARRRALAELRAKVEEGRSRAAGASAAGPAIEIVRPDVLATRGPAIVPVPAGTTEMEVRGQVIAPAGLGELTADGRPLAVDEKGLFRTTIPFAAERREVELVASDRLERRARVTLVLQPGTSRLPPPAPPRSPRTSPVAPAPDAEASTGGKALIIGVADYRYFSDLATAGRDAEEIAEILADKYGFSTRVLKNPGKLAITRELVELIDQLAADEKLIIYYAGHGRIETEGGNGFWIPADAKPDEPKSWLPNEAISNYLDSMPARQVLVVSDSCYSGTLTRSGLTRVEPDRAGGRRPPSAGDRRTRTVLTSGGLQPVLDEGGGDHSLFAAALLRVLELFDETLSGETLHRKVAARVVAKADDLGVDQVPLYAPIQFAGHEAGDFILVPRGAPSAPASR